MLTRTDGRERLTGGVTQVPAAAVSQNDSHPDHLVLATPRAMIRATYRHPLPIGSDRETAPLFQGNPILEYLNCEVRAASRDVQQCFLRDP